MGVMRVGSGKSENYRGSMYFDPYGGTFNFSKIEVLLKEQDNITGELNPIWAPDWLEPHLRIVIYRQATVPSYAGSNYADYYFRTQTPVVNKAPTRGNSVGKYYATYSISQQNSYIAFFTVDSSLPS